MPATRRGSTFTLAVPRDFVLARDVCSYGYFLLAPNHWDVATRTFSRPIELAGGPAGLTVSQQGGPGRALRVRVDRALARAERADAAAALTRMFRLDEDAETIGAFHRLDPRFARSGRGRLFRSPTLFEDVIKTVTSCNVTWPSTLTMNRRLCEVFGEPPPSAREGAGPWRTFPSARRLARARPASLRARCSVGYRDARIVALARLFESGAIDQPRLEDPRTPDDAVFNALVDLPGIGPYAAANIMQLMGRYSRLPLDTESLRHGRTVLGMKGTERQVMKALHAHYAPFGAHAFRSYWFELWEFYEKKAGPSWTWERDSTGRVFTASQLNAR